MRTKNDNREQTGSSYSEVSATHKLKEYSKKNIDAYGDNWNYHMLAQCKRQTLSRILYFDNLYKKIVNVPGVICEFGLQWGASTSILLNLRGIYEPYNHARTIFGFDTFEGFVNIDDKDGGYSSVGDYLTKDSYENELDEILSIHESFSPIAHKKKFQLIKGDASITIDEWLKNNPHAIVSMVIFDMDVYKPTKDVLEKIIPRLTKGSILVFDELNCPVFPGETEAVMEVLGLNNVSLRQHPHQPYAAWAVWGE